MSISYNTKLVVPFIWDDFLGEVEQFFADALIAPREAGQLTMAIEEVIANIVNHGKTDNSQKVIAIDFSIDEQSVTITINDNCQQFTLQLPEEETIREKIKARQKGGLGLFMIYRLMDNVDYSYSETGNKIVLHKKITVAVNK